MKQKNFILGTMILSLCVIFTSFNVYAQGRMYRPIQITQPSRGFDQQPNPQNPNNGYGYGHHGGMRRNHGGIHNGFRNGEIGGQMRYGHQGGYYPLLEENQIQLTGTVTELNENEFSMINGYLVVDYSQASIQYLPWFISQAPVEDVTIEEGQRVSLLGEIIETESGLLVVASTIRVMDAIHYDPDPSEGGISGIIEQVYEEEDMLILAGLPIRMNENTFIREMGRPIWDSDESPVVIQKGDQATIHVKLVDTDEDGVDDSLWAEVIRVHSAVEDFQP